MPQFNSCRSNRLPASADAAVFCFEKSKHPVGTYIYGSGVEKALAEAQSDGFEGKKAQVAVVHPKDGRFVRFIFIGLGKESDATLDDLRKGSAIAARRAEAIGCRSLCVKPPHLSGATADAQAVAEGIALGLYRYTEYKTAPTPAPKLETVLVVTKDAEEESLVKRGLVQGSHFAQAVCFARDLINRPPSDTTPETLVKTARKISGGKITLRVFNKAQITKLGMGALLGVNRGSNQAPYFLHLTYRPANKVSRTIGICGKGITFDSGGLSLKPAASMETMKYDMAGAATVLGIFHALAKLKPPSVEVHGFAPMTENLPGPNAVKPGDVLKSMSGKTIEVLNTDAEGRLVLADALTYASRQNLDEVIDVATLTGACVIALGNQIAAVLGTSADLIGKLKEASARAGEKIWELPLEKEYEQQLKSTVADLKNIGSPGQAGTIMGALFLKEFVKKGLPWAHLDIASTGWATAPTPLSEAGATGVMIRSLLHHILSYT